VIYRKIGFAEHTKLFFIGLLCKLVLITYHTDIVKWKLF